MKGPRCPRCCCSNLTVSNAGVRVLLVCDSSQTVERLDIHSAAGPQAPPQLFTPCTQCATLLQYPPKLPYRFDFLACWDEFVSCVLNLTIAKRAPFLLNSCACLASYTILQLGSKRIACIWCMIESILERSANLHVRTHCQWHRHMQCMRMATSITSPIYHWPV